MKMAALKSRHKGLTIIEVLISVLIISIGLVAAVNLIASSLSDFGITSGKLSEVGLAQKRIEEIRNMRDSGQNISGLPEVSGSNPYVITVEQGNTTIINHLYDWKK